MSGWFSVLVDILLLAVINALCLFDGMLADLPSSRSNMGRLQDLLVTSSFSDGVCGSMLKSVGFNLYLLIQPVSVIDIILLTLDGFFLVFI